jgi:hypothetical protein
MRILISAIVCACFFTASRAEAAPCDAAVANISWRSAIGAYNAKNFEDAAKTLDQMIADCGSDPITYHPQVMRAELALRADDDALALLVLQPVPMPAGPPIGSYSSWLAMTAALAKKDLPTFATERDALLKAMDIALTDPVSAAHGQLIERF